MNFLDENPIKSSPDKGCLVITVFLIGGAFKLGHHLLKTIDEVKKCEAHHSFLWLTTACAGLAGFLFFIFSFLDQPRIILTNSKYIDMYHAIILTIIAFSLAVCSLILYLLRYVKPFWVEIKNRIDRTDKAPIIAVFLLLKDLGGFIKDTYRHKIKDIREKKNKNSL